MRGLFLTLILTLASLSCETAPRSFLMGVTFWPPANPSLASRSDVFGAFVKRTLEASELVQFQTAWSPVQPDMAGAARSIAWVARQHGRKFSLALEWLDWDRRLLRDSNDHPWSFGDPSVQTLFLEKTIAAAVELKPEFFVLGIEVNFLALYRAQDFREFVSLYRKAREGIHAVSPSTKVLVSFQYDWVRGANHPDFPIGPHPQVIAAFGSDLDMVGISTYPHGQYRRPQDIPADFFDAIPDLGRPIGIFETTWRTEGDDSRYSVEVQDEFVRWLLAAAQAHRFEVVLWTCASDTLSRTELPPERTGSVYGMPWSFGALGLWTLEGQAKPGATRWLAALHRHGP